MKGRGGMGGFGGGGMGGMGGLQGLMKQANEMQNKIKKIQEELAQRVFEATSGGGAVEVKVKGTETLLSLKISDDVMKSGDVEMLQDLILTATNEAFRKARETQAKEMEKVTGGMNLPF